MSWDSYLDNLMGHCADACDFACIIGLDGSKWTTDAHANHFKMSAEEAGKIAAAIKSAEFTVFQSSGIVAGGIKYQFLKEEDKKIVLGKKKDNGAITMQKSKTAIVIGHCKEGSPHGNVNKGVAVIAEYLESLNM